MIFYFQPKTEAYKSWEQIKVGDRVLYKSIADEPATVRDVMESMAAIEFDKPTPRITGTPHDCLGKVPSGNGYFVIILALIEKIIE